VEDIVKALAEYQSLLTNLTWLKENGQLPDDADIGAMAFQGAIYFTPPHVVEAFVAAMEIAKTERERQAAQPKRVRASSGEKAVAEHEAQEQREKDMKARAKLLSSELALSL